MSLARTFVGFSSTDLKYYRTMQMWKAHEHIDFDFCDCQLQDALNSTNEDYIKRRCRERLQMAGTYILLIGDDTRFKTTYVKWEAQVAIEKRCRLIAANIDGWREMNPSTCPLYFQAVGAVFVPFSPHIIAYALNNWVRPDPPSNNWHYFYDWVYQHLGYTIIGNRAVRPPKVNAFAPRY